MKASITLALMCCFLFVFCGSALAADLEPQSSEVIASCSTTLKQGSGNGNVVVRYSVTGKNKQSTRIGVLSVKIYKSNGTCVATVAGTTTNGLIAMNVNSHSGTYTYSGTSGVSYYAVVTFTAAAGGVTDSRTVTTNTVTAP